MESRPYSWVALDPDCDHPLDDKEKDKEKHERKCHCDVCCNGNGFFGNDNAFIDQDLAQANLNKQVSDETIIIRDSCDINVTSTDVQAVTSVVTALNAAVVTATLTSIADGVIAELVAQDLLQLTANKQVNRQKLLIECSRGVNVTTVDADIATLISTATNTLVAILVITLVL
ncbi:spore coat protein CotX [Bacillus subtilis]|jgi:Spore Coat Protein X and V domain.|uniref:Spore coat protein X n=4 Tax=Bacillus subtilis TaxID=1423 RepID=COTX_BACSU|nr:MULTISPECIES: spore coat protein CotX [Bacillales]NP_389058.1 spore coat protein (insoluble fraction) [Bacillus subtilis subsp. subtilis str. 168]Q08313.1 RecName: Full=Spore coat protein X [Bacillus subtilis subsp. subtilis str. 168]WJD93676.1 spore coat protein CotX [Bacillus spizizenii]BAM50097.1 spore coat protein [Bacillus subtilis BEST7613]AAA22327.1 spore coat protein [Bacillus subtilis]ADV96167.1 spore coat protein X [Bacillus subtilis BSn5]AFQ57092.1 Spore coat protein (insoluble